MTAPSAWRPLSEAPKDRAIFVKCKGMRFVSPANDEFRCSHEGALFAPIADTYELDRAVQKAIAEAFGALIGILGTSEKCGSSARAQLALTYFRRSLHTAMGGRIPDEVP